MTTKNLFLKTFSVLLTVFLISCSPAELKPAEYIEWNDNTENNMIKEYQQNKIMLTCQYTTPEYVVLKQSNPSALDEYEINENIAAINDMVHFKLKFQDTTSANFMRDNHTTPEEFNLRSMYMSYDIRYDLKAVIDGDTADCMMNHHERTYGSTPYETLLLSFPKGNKELGDVELIFNDQVFGLGRVKFFFAKEDIEAIPKLVF